MQNKKLKKNTQLEKNSCNKKTFYKLDEEVLSIINSNKKTQFIIEVNSTINLNKILLKKIKNNKVTFIIKSALLETKYYNNKDDKYKKRTLFSLSKTKKIINTFEKLDKKVLLKTELEKVIFIYNYLIKHIKYEDKKCHDVHGNDIRRTLYSIVSRKAVCSGFALVFYEALIRNNIQCYYIHSQNHLFNVVQINKNFYPIDITWEAVLKEKTQDSLFHYLGNYPLFNQTHILLEDEPRFKYCYFDTKIISKQNALLKTTICIREDATTLYYAELPIGSNVKYYVVFDKQNNIFDVISSYEDFDRIMYSNNDKLKECYVNSLLNGQRLIDKINNFNKYVGYGEISNGTFYKHNKCENILKIETIRNKNMLKFVYDNKLYNVCFKGKKFVLNKERMC